MKIGEEDAEVLSWVGHRLLRENAERFREAHEMAMEGFDARSAEGLIESFGQAISREQEAIERQREAIELQRQMIAVRARRLARMKAALED